MKLLYAYTVPAYAAAGLTIPNSSQQTWDRVGASPFIQLQSSPQVIYTSGLVWLAVNTGYAYIRAQLFDAIRDMKDGDILTAGVRLMRGTAWPNSSTAAMQLAGTSLLSWLDLANAAGASLSMYLEVSIDPVKNKATTYIDGRKVAEVAIPPKANLSGVNISLIEYSGQSNVVYIADMYAAVFEPSDGTTRLNAWACDTLTQVKSELPANRTVVDQPIVIEYTPPVNETLAVGADIQAFNAQLYSELNVVISDGVTQNAGIVKDVLQEYATGTTTITTNSGRPTPSLTPANNVAKISLTLKATVK